MMPSAAWKVVRKDDVKAMEKMMEKTMPSAVISVEKTMPSAVTYT